MNCSGYRDQLNSRINRVFASHPDIPDHRQQLPWVTGYLGDPYSGIWFVAENPSLTTGLRASRANGAPLTVESQWAISAGDQLLRKSLVQCGFKEAPWDSPGGWHCYVTDVIKQAEQVDAWQRQQESRWMQVTDVWADVLAWELEASHPSLVVIMGKRTRRLIEHLELTRHLRFPRTAYIQSYSYVGSRPRGKQPAMHPDRVREYQDEMARVAHVFAEIRPSFEAGTRL
jgi:hypothetical protein